MTATNVTFAPVALPTPASPFHLVPDDGQNAPIPSAPAGRKKLWLLLAALLIVLGLAGGGYYAYSKGLLALPFLSPKPDALFNTMVGSLSDIKNAQYTLRLNVAAEPRASGAQPIIGNLNLNGNVSAQPATGLSPPDALSTYMALLGMATNDEALRSLPTDLHLSAGVTFALEADKPIEDASGQFAIDATYTGGDATIAVDGEIRKAGKDLYAIVRKFPSLFFVDFSALKGKWVIIHPDDDAFLDQETLQKLGGQNIVDRAKDALSVIFAQALFTVGQQLSSETISGVPTAHYRLTPHVEKLADVYRALREQQQQRGKPTALFDAAIQALEKPENQQLLQQIAGNSQFDIWVEKARGLLHQTTWTLTLVPPDTLERLKEKQFRIELQLTLDHINQGVRLERPEETIGYDEAERLLTGITKEEQQFQQQTERVRDLRSALNLYHEATGVYPDALDQLHDGLAKKLAQCESEKTKTNARSTYACSSYETYAKKTIKTTDLFTGNPYGYAKDGADYKLTYEIRFFEGMSEYEKETYVEGTNTATSQEVSAGLESPAKRDAKRIADVRQLQSALELYYNDQLTPGYPIQATAGPLPASLLVPTYLQSIPDAPTPADNPAGVTTCSDGSPANNTYRYQSLTSQGGTSCSQAPCGWYTLAFCIGSSAGGVTPGAHVAEPSGISPTDQPSQRATNTATNINTASHTNTTNSGSAEDSDSDGLNDQQETTYKTDPKKTDTDGDGLGDYEEAIKYRTDGTKKDSDGDGYDDQTEVTNGFNPVGSGKANADQLSQWEGKPTLTGGPVLSDMHVTPVSGKATVSWTTNTAADGIVNYGATTAYGQHISNFAFTAQHAIDIPTTSGTVYHYSIRSCTPNPNSLCTATPDQTFIAL